MKNPNIGRVTLVGAGPGDPDLLTLKALKAINAADVVVFDRLVASGVLALVPADIRQIDVGKKAGYHSVPQDEINELLISLALQGLHVVRLKGGDPLIFGRGGEELAALRAAGVTCACIPGITAAQGAAASLQLPLTQRGTATGVRYVTGHRAANKALHLDWASLASSDTTLVVYMGAANIREIANQLMNHGLCKHTPVVAVVAATTIHERRIPAKLNDIARTMTGVSHDEPVLFIIGEVAGFVDDSASLLRHVHESNVLAPA